MAGAVCKTISSLVGAQSGCYTSRCADLQAFAASCFPNAWVWAPLCLAADDCSFLATPCMHDRLLARRTTNASLSAPSPAHLTNTPGKMLVQAMRNLQGRLSLLTLSSYQLYLEQDSLATLVTTSETYKPTLATNRASISDLSGAATSAASRPTPL